MRGTVKSMVGTVAAGLCLLAVTASVHAQQGQAPAAPVANAAPAGDVIGVGTFIHSVADANRSISFYSDLFGIMPNPTAMPRVFAPNEVVANLYGTPGTPYRGGTIRIPGTEIAGTEFGEWQGIERHPVALIALLHELGEEPLRVVSGPLRVGHMESADTHHRAALVDEAGRVCGGHPRFEEREASLETTRGIPMSPAP